MVRLNQAVANKLISSVDYLRESFVGTLERCLDSLEKSHIESSVHNITSNHLKQVSGCVDVLISRPIYEACSSALSSDAAIERRLSRGGHLPLRILRHQALLGANQTGRSPTEAAGAVPVHLEGLSHWLFLLLSQIIHRITFVNPPAITPEWKRKVAQDAIESLSAAKLARSICSQFRTRLNSSHEAFAASLRQVRLLFYLLPAGAINLV